MTAGPSHKSGQIGFGLLLEYLYNHRDLTAPPIICDDDTFARFGLGLNETQNTAILGGAIIGDDETLATLRPARYL